MAKKESKGKERELPAEFKALAKPFEKSAYKEVRLGDRAFTTIDAYHIIERLTEIFGMCGKGWGIESLRFSEHQAPILSKGEKTKGKDGEARYTHSVSCVGSLWYMEGDQRLLYRRSIPTVGDAAVIGGNVAEAMKKAQTNMISKAASFLGVGLSVYQGKGIDDPYLDREAQQQEGTSAEVLRYCFADMDHETYEKVVDWLGDRGITCVNFGDRVWHSEKPLPKKFNQYLMK